LNPPRQHVQPWQRRLGKAVVVAIRAHPCATELHIRGLRVLEYLPRSVGAGEKIDEYRSPSPATPGFPFWK